MYYIVERQRSDKPDLAVLARCETIRGLARRLKQERDAYDRNYGVGTIFPSRPWPVKADTEPTLFDQAATDQARYELSEYEYSRED